MSNPNNSAISHLYPGRTSGLVTRVAPGTRNFVPKFPRPSQRNRSRSALRQVIVAVVALLACVGLGVAGADEFLTRRDAAEAIAMATNKQLYIGTILFYPDLGNRCHQLYFDNRNGRFADNGSVDCTRAASDTDTSAPKDASSARTSVISQGFH